MRLMIALALLVMLCTASCQGGMPVERQESPSLPSGDWSAPDHDFQHTNRSPYAGPTDPQLKWAYTLESGPLWVSPITDDGRVYATCGRLLLAFDLGGELLWQAEANEPYDSAPAVGPDGTVYTGGELLRAYTPDGQLKWYSSPLKGEFSEPAVGSNGKVYVMGDEALYQFSAEGEMLWADLVPGEVPHAALIDQDGRAYVRELDQGYDLVLVLSESGALLANMYWLDTELSDPALSADGWLYFLSFDQTQLDIADDDDFPVDYYSELHAVNLGTSESWTQELTGRDPLSVLVGFDGSVYALTNDQGAPSSDLGGAFYRFSAQGDLLAQADNPEYFTQELVSIAPDGRVFTLGNNIDSPGFFSQIFDADGLESYYAVSDKSRPYPPVHFSQSGDNITVDGGQGRGGLIEYRGLDGGLQWSYRAGPDGGQVLLSPDGGVVLSGSRIWKFSRSGQKLWSTEAGTPYSYQSLAIGIDGTIYTVATLVELDGWLDSIKETYLTAISSDGKEVWRQPITTDSKTYGPLQAADGSIYVLTRRGILSFAPDGSPKWELSPEDYFGLSIELPMPVVATDGTLYLSYLTKPLGNLLNCLAAISPDGTLAWQYYSDLRPNAMVLTEDKGLFLTKYDGVSSFDTDGSPLWDRASSSTLNPTLTISKDDHLHVVSTTAQYPEPVHSSLLCLSPDGQWVPERQIDLPAGFRIHDVVSDDESRVYVGQAALPEEVGELAEQTGVCAYSESGELLWQYFTEEPAGGLAIDSDGTLYFTCDGRLCALGD